MRRWRLSDPCVWALLVMLLCWGALVGYAAHQFWTWITTITGR